MRVWEIPPEFLCRNHLLGEHREIHRIFNVIVNGKKGYSQHPETKRWRSKLRALGRRHSRIALEMHSRKYNHRSPLPYIDDWPIQSTFINTPEEQIAILREKGCDCRVQSDEQAMLVLRKIAEDSLYLFTT